MEQSHLTEDSSIFLVLSSSLKDIVRHAQEDDLILSEKGRWICSAQRNAISTILATGCDWPV